MIKRFAINHTSRIKYSIFKNDNSFDQSIVHAKDMAEAEKYFKSVNNSDVKIIQIFEIPPTNFQERF